MNRVAILAASLLCLGFNGPRAAETRAADLKPDPQVLAQGLARIEVFPARVQLSSARQTMHLVVTGYGLDGTARDLTRLATFKSSDPCVLDVRAAVARPVADGRCRILVEVGAKAIGVEAEVEKSSAPDSVSFRNETIAVLTKQGCNAGSCHGSPSGKGGFSLSMMGYDPQSDWRTLTRAGWSRRTNPIEPELSLLLRKPTMRVTHGGGRRLRPADPAFGLLRDWIAQGCQADLEQAPALEWLEIYPGSGRVLMFPAQRQQLLVLAHYRDGSVRDVTAIAAYTSSEDSIAQVSPAGLVEGRDRGAISISVRYLDEVAARTFMFVRPVEGLVWNNPRCNNEIDNLVHEQLRLLGYRPSETCTDSEFLRRASLDVVGLLPIVDETRAFLADRSADKRAQLINRLLDRPEFARYWGQKQADLLRVTAPALTEEGARRFYGWIVEQVAANRPFDQFVKDLLTSTGNTYEHPQANYFRAAADTSIVTETTAQLFMGVRLACAKCHNHPFDRWTQDNYYGIAAVFDRMRREKVSNGEKADNGKEKKANKKGTDGPMMITVSKSGELRHPRTGKVMKPWLPLRGEVPLGPDEDARQAFAQWLTSPDNPFFARVEVNRIWAQVMGRGIVDPVDDFHSGNPPSNENLLSYLAGEFVKHGYDRKQILRLILNSSTYQRSVARNAWNEQDSRHFSAAQVRLIAAEPLFDAIGRVTEVAERFPGVADATPATQMPTPPRSEFLEAFGQPRRETACQCERASEPTLPQALQLLNGEAVQKRLSAPNNRIRRVLAAGKSNDEIVEEFYLAAFCRRPTATEQQRALAYVSSKPDRSRALEDLLWALLNSKEFLFQH